MKFPAYPIRHIGGSFNEGRYLCLSTYRSRYVLDYLDGEGSYLERRIQLLGDDRKPYSLYPITHTINTPQELVQARSKVKKLYFGDGKVLNWKKTKFYSITPRRILARWLLDTGHSGLQLKGVDYPITSTEWFDSKYALTVEFLGTICVVGFTNDKEEGAKRIKL